MQAFHSKQKFSLIVPPAFCLLAPLAGYIKIGLAPVIIIGGCAMVAFDCWYLTYLKKPVEPGVILPLFILTVAALQIYIVEEY